MYLFEDVNKWEEFKCEICKRKFKSWKGLSKHIQQQPKTHLELEEYKRQYFPPGYTNGISPNNKCLYVLCDPEYPGEFKYEADLFGEYTELLFCFMPIYVGCGNMGGKYGRYRLNSGKDCNEYLYNRIQELKSENLKVIQYIIKEGLTIQQGKEGEKLLIPLIGRQNYPDSDSRGPLLNRNSGGDGVLFHTQETRDQMSESRKGNKNRCDKWMIIRIKDGHEIITDDFTTTCEELGLNKKRIHEVANGYQKTHRGYICKNLTKRK